jgi:ectoine hydrolase
MSEYKDRLRRVRHTMQQAGVDVKIVMNHPDIHWLTGTRVTMENGPNDNQLIIWDGDPIMVVRHIEALAHKSSSGVNNWAEYYDEGPLNPYDPMKKVAEVLRMHGLDKKRIGINFRLTTLQNYDRLRRVLPEADICDFRVETTRIIRSELEQECHFRAAKANQDALMNTINDMEIGWSQQDVESCISRYHEKYLGNDYEKSDVLCTVGSDVMLMHAMIWGGERKIRKIREGDLVYLEPGTFVKRYAGMMIRMVFFGEPPVSVRRSAEGSIEALNRAIEATAPGKTSHEVDKAARDYFVKMGLDCQGRLGYACGSVDWSQGNVMSIEPNNPLVLAPGHIFHYISINYLPGWGYVGASEQVLVTEDGHEVLADPSRTCERVFFAK